MSIDDVAPTATTWTTGRIITKELVTPTTIRLRMHVDNRLRHWPGQHYLLRLRAPDDYTAQRSYSVASDDNDALLEMRGPTGRWFTWDVRTPALCLVGGTGIVLAISMSRAARHAGRTDALRILTVGRSPDEMPYGDELRRFGATIAYTRRATGTRRAGPPAGLLHDQVTVVSHAA